MLQYLEVLIEANYSSWCEGQWQKVGEREPEPELGEDQQADHGRHVSVTGPGLQRDGHITSTWTTKRCVRGFQYYRTDQMQPDLKNIMSQYKLENNLYFLLS